MKEKRITPLEQLKMGRVFDIALEAEAWRLLGVNWKEYCEVSIDPCKRDLVFRYK